jgi:teichoic acid transport system ATP-binding protein
MISFRPEILIVDEALSVGDIFFQQKCNVYMRNEMCDVTKILVSHDMNSITSMANRVILLDGGKIIKEGSPLEVVEEYLKVMHTEIFSHGTVVKQEAQPIIETNETDGWVVIENDNVGGAGDVKIECVRCTINGENGEIVKPGDKVELHLRFESYKHIQDIIIGYTFKDKYGNSIFAQSTAGARIEVGSVNINRYMVYIAFHWPEIKEGEYFLTLGIGEGKDEMFHIIQCWAHNVIHMTAIALNPMHGIINHTIDNFNISLI